MNLETKQKIEVSLITGILNDRLNDLLSGGSIYGENFSGIGWAFKTVNFDKYLCESFPIYFSDLNEFNQVLAVYSGGKPIMEIPTEEYLFEVQRKRAGDFHWLGLKPNQKVQTEEEREAWKTHNLSEFGLWAGSYYNERIKELSDGSLYGPNFTGIGWAFVDKDPPPHFHLYNSLHSRISHEAGRPGYTLAWYSNGQPIMPYDSVYDSQYPSHIKQALESTRFKRDNEVLKAMVPKEFEEEGVPCSAQIALFGTAKIASQR